MSFPTTGRRRHRLPPARPRRRSALRLCSRCSRDVGGRARIERHSGCDWAGGRSLLRATFGYVRFSATDRITIRLRPGDGEWITHRAAQRGMKRSAYLSALVRAHIAQNPPLAANELSALKLSVVVLAGLGRLLAPRPRRPRESPRAIRSAHGQYCRTRAANPRPRQGRAGQLGEPQCLGRWCGCPARANLPRLVQRRPGRSTTGTFHGRSDRAHWAHRPTDAGSHGQGDRRRPERRRRGRPLGLHQPSR